MNGESPLMMRLVPDPVVSGYPFPIQSLSTNTVKVRSDTFL